MSCFGYSSSCCCMWIYIFLFFLLSSFFFLLSSFFILRSSFFILHSSFFILLFAALAATLLRHLNDRDAFWSFLILCNDTLAGYFDDPGTHQAMTFELWVFQDLLSSQLPNVNYVLTTTFNSLFVAMDTPMEYEGIVHDCCSFISSFSQLFNILSV